MSQGSYTHVTRASGTILTAAIYNTDHQNHIINQNPMMTGAYSDTLAQFQSVTNPGNIGSESLPASLAGELERIRWQIRAITGEAQWNQAPSSNLKGVAGTPDGGVPLSKLAYTTQGNILMRTAAGVGAWQASQIKDLAPLVPVAGDFILGQAAAGGAPRRIDARDVVSNPGVIMPQGRLTLGSGVPFATGNYNGIGSIYYTPYVGQLVPTWNGTTLVANNMGGELSQTSIDNTKSPAAAAASSIYDIFFWMDPEGNTPRISRGPPWANATNRGLGAGTTELVRIGGIMTNKWDITKGPLANRGTYLGSVYTRGDAKFALLTIAGQEQSFPGWMGLYNYYHRARLTMAVRQTANWAVGDEGSWHYLADNGNNGIYILGGVEQQVSVNYKTIIEPGGGNVGGTTYQGNLPQIQIGYGAPGTAAYQASTGPALNVAVPGGALFNSYACTAEAIGLWSTAVNSFWMAARGVPGTNTPGGGAYPLKGWGVYQGVCCTMMIASCWY